MIFHWPQLAYLALLVLGTGAHLAKNGQPKTGTYSFFGALVSDALIITMLYFGGFFTGAQP